MQLSCLTLFGGGLAYEHLWQETFAARAVFRSSALCLLYFSINHLSSCHTYTFKCNLLSNSLVIYLVRVIGLTRSLSVCSNFKDSAHGCYVLKFSQNYLFLPSIPHTTYKQDILKCYYLL